MRQNLGGGRVVLYNRSRRIRGDGSVGWSYIYFAFGEEFFFSEDEENPFRYCGEYWDSETQTYYLRARYYDPAIGRFTQQDPVPHVSRELPNGVTAIDPLSLNLYTYCANNPIAYCDPSGHWIESVWDAANILLDAYDIQMDLYLGNYWMLPIDIAAAIGDVAALSTPLIPGGIGTVRAPARTAKTLKVFDKIQDGIGAGRKLVTFEKAFLRREARKYMLEASINFADAVKSGTRLDVHHIIPLEWAHVMGEGFDPNMLDNLVGVAPDIHKEINSRWMRFKKQNKTPSMDEILDFVSDIEDEYGKHFVR